MTCPLQAPLIAIGSFQPGLLSGSLVRSEAPVASPVALRSVRPAICGKQKTLNA